MDAHETSLYTAVLIAGLVIICLTVYFALSVIWHHRKHSRLQRQNFFDEISLLEKERTRVARDLHDELAPLLSLTRFQIAGIKTRDAAETEPLQKANSNLERVMLRLGEIAVNLNASVLVRKGFRFALADFFLEVEALSPLKIQFLYDAVHEVPVEMGIHLYRIVQEVVHNALKHSGATLMDVQVTEQSDKLFLYLGDNGRGFCYEQSARDSAGIGLRSIRSRTGMLGGQFECLSALRNGTSYFLEFPFTSKTAYDKSFPCR